LWIAEWKTKILNPNFDEIVKSQKSRNSCESSPAAGGTKLIELTGFPLPAFAGTSFEGMTKMGPKGLFMGS
jgi:hypothetical protein